jgi:hypothetical protein
MSPVGLAFSPMLLFDVSFAISVSRREQRSTRSQSSRLLNRTKTRKLANLDRFVETVRSRYPRSSVNVADFATLALKDQVDLVQQTDVYIGHHGAAMGHLLYLRPESAMVEILPPWFSTFGFRYAAQVLGLAYVAGRALRREEWNLMENGVPLPSAWSPPHSEEGCQQTEWAYIMEEQEFI